MAELNPSIILAGQQPNFLRTLGEAAVTAGNTNNVMQQNALRGFLRDNGAAVMAGDKNALGQYAGFDPQAALGIQDARQQMQAREEQLRLARAAGARAAANFKMTQEQAAQLKAEQEKLRQGILAYENAKATGDSSGFDQWLQATGMDKRGVNAGNFEVAAALFDGAMSAAWQGSKPQGPEFTTISGDQAAAMGLDPSRAYNLGKDGKITAIGGGDTNINVNTAAGPDARPEIGTIPQGYQARFDAEKNSFVLEPLQGGEPARDAAGAERASQLAAADYDRKFNIVDGKLTEAIESLEKNGRWVAGYGSKLSDLPETEARNFQATLDTIKANLGFAELQSMKETSPTGGALGQVTEREIAFLQAVEGNLDAAQSPEQLLRVLREIQTRRREFAAERQRIMGGGSQAPGSDSQPGSLPPELQSVFDKYK